jgi:hypothetical protein
VTCTGTTVSAFIFIKQKFHSLWNWDMLVAFMNNDPDFEIYHLPYILKSSLHPFCSFRGLKIRCRLESSAD